MDRIFPLHITQAYNLDIAENDLDFFDANLFYDTLLFIDPFLLKRSPIEEERELFKRFSLFFKKAYEKSISSRNNEQEIQNLKLFLTFKEPKEINLGYTKSSNTGSGPGPDFAESLLSFFLESSAARLVTSDNLFPENNFNPNLVSIFANKFGEDGISDLSANLIMDYLISYTQIQAEKWNIPRKILPVHQSFDIDEEMWTNGVNANLPENPLRPGEPIIFVPKRLLRNHHISDKDDAIRKVIGILRRDPILVNRFSNLIEKPLKEIAIDEIRNVLSREDSVLRIFVNSLEQKQVDPYDFNKDLLGFLAIKRYEHAFDSLESVAINTCGTLIKQTLDFIDIFRQEYELRDGWKDAWKEPNHKEPAREDVIGRKFRGMGFAFFNRFQNISFIPQVGTGNGFLDFAVIYGSCRIAIELKKLSNNSPTGTPPLAAYIHGIKKQLPAYVQSLPASNAIYLTIQHYRETTRGGKNHDSRANEIRSIVREVQGEIKSHSSTFNNLYYFNIDATPKSSPSNL